MLKNYFKIAIRTLWKQKGYSFINIAGLSLGVAAAILLFLYGQYELSWDRFNEKGDEIYLVYKERVTPSGTQDTFDTWVPLQEELLNTYPAISASARQSNQTSWVEGNEKKFRESITYTDGALFDIFSFELQEGNRNNPFPDLYSAVITQEIAEKYFGDENPVGKELRLDFETSYTIAGVLNKIPDNSSVQIDIAVQLESSPDYSNFENNWGTSFLNTYVLLNPEVNPDELEAQFPDLISKIWDEETSSRTHFKLMPILELNNYFTNSDRYAFIHLGIALIIMVIACINFMNMSTARSLERAKEVGMRKALGAHRYQLIYQFLSEAVIQSLIAVAFGVLLAEWILPFFNILYDVNLNFGIIGNLYGFLSLISGAVIVGVAAGTYPAFFLSGFQSSETLRGKITNQPGGISIRNGLVITQFAITVLLIIGTLVIQNQVQHMKNVDLGFAKENILVIQAGLGDFDNPEQAVFSLETFKNEVSKLSEVRAVSSSEDIPGRWSDSFTFIIPEGRDEENPMRVRYSFIDHAFFSTWDIETLEGRSFREGSESDQQQAVILNKAALEEFGWDTGVGKQIGLGTTGRTKLNVVGVVDNYNFQSLQNSVAPVMHVYRQPDNSIHNFISVRLQSSDLGATITSLSELWSIIDPGREMDYFFADENFNQLFQRQEQLSTIAASFSSLAIFIACMGLLGLISLMIRKRTKEIGIRKVLGATSGSVVLLLSGDYMKLVLAGFIIAIPIAWYLMNQWLQDFAYRIDLKAGVFIQAGAIVFLIAFAMVCIQTYRAAISNPVESLKNE